MAQQEVFTGYLASTSSSLLKSRNIKCIFPKQGKPKQGWFDLFQIAEDLQFSYNFSICFTKPDALICVVDNKTHNLFAELGLIQLLVYAHPNLDEKIRMYVVWQLYDNSPMMNGFSGREQVNFIHNGGSLHDIKFNPKSNKEITSLVY